MARLVAALAFCVCIFLGAAQRPTLWLFSDSLGWQARAAFNDTVQRAGYAMRYVGFPGTAICDWFNQTLAVGPTDVITMQFSGNSFTPCMVDPTTKAHFTGNRLLDKYAHDSVRATRNLLSVGARAVVWQGSPVTEFAVAATPNDRQVSAMYMVLPHVFGSRVFYNDAGLAVVAAPTNTSFTPTLPCLPVEVAKGVCASTSDVIQVRAPDGTHFCPKPGSDGMTCLVYCSGCYRFGTAMALSAIAAAKSK